VSSAPLAAAYRSSLPDIGWPAVPGPNAAALLAQLYQLEHSQWLAKEALAELQLLQLGRLAAYANRHSPFWRKQFALHEIAAEKPWTEATLARVPLLTREVLAERGKSIECPIVPRGHEPLQSSQTSGSTGQIVEVKRTAPNGLMWMALTMRDHMWHRRDFTRSLCVIRANAEPRDDDAVARKDGWGMPATLLFETGPGYCQPLSLGIREQAAWLLHRDPTYLLTYPTNLNALLDEFARIGRRPPQLAEVRSLGETLPDSLRLRCSTEFGLRVVDAYSSQEVGVIAIQCPVSGLYHVQSESLIVEVIGEDGAACGEGDVGRVVVTDLHNFATPLIRYEIRDYAEVAAPCPCGRGLPTLRRILGRSRNMVTLPDGSRHWPMLGFHAFRAIAAIRQYQAIQHTLENIEIRLVVSAPLRGDQEAALTAVVREALGYPFILQFSYYDAELPKSRGGKFEEFISALQ
jgi:phenylacetate-CoA ligase